MINKLILLCTSLPATEYRFTVSTAITLVRIIVTPIIVLLLCYQHIPEAFVLFVCAALTDMLDGALARARNEQTFLGACLDPIADKILLISCFATLAWIKTPLFPIPQWFVWLVLIKELLLIIGIIFLYVYTGVIRIFPTQLSKITTLIQICFIGWLFICYFYAWLPIKTQTVSLLILCCLIAATLLHYGYIGFTALWK
ncbi:MAG TPA: CDP-alcohol phosphatidyltransferase family protein [Candidatus Babeliales bacterium]|jgi:cardiolipin synthase|nr:CDP-alcohol phosphatidyltransferase family protein [Candidatus Babeliales bacterium]